jgi:hypothetical protein
MKTIILVFCILFAQSSLAKTPSAHDSAARSVAQETTPAGELYFQPAEGQQAAVVGIDYSSSHFSTANGTSSTKTTGLQGLYQYGLSQNHALGLALSYSSTKPSGGETYKGLDDIVFSFRGMYPMETGRLRYGAELQWSVEPQKDNASGDTDNQFSGANLLNPYVGYEFSIMPQGNLGFSISKEFLIGKRIEEASNGTQTKSTGGETTVLKAYYEHFIEQNVLGASLEYDQLSDTKFDAGTSDGLNLWALTLYSRWLVAENLSVLPRIGYGEALSSSINNIKIDKIYVLDFYVGARYSF